MTPAIPLPRFAALALGLLALPGCLSRQIRPPDLGRLYGAAAQTHDSDRNPVILIPGILGSTLKERGTDRVVWGAFTGDYADPRKRDGARLFSLPMSPGVPLSELRDEVYASGALESLRIRLFGLPIGVSAYINIISALGIGGYRDQQLSLAGAVDYGEGHFTCFQFSYDWRRDLSENAALLDAFIREKKVTVEQELRARYGIERDVRFDVVGHSMGGLLLRYYLRHGAQVLADDGSAPELDWSGARNVERAILVGTPNAGSVSAFLELMQGTKIGPFLPRYEAPLVSTLPAVFQLLPRERHGVFVDMQSGERLQDIYDAALWRRLEWGPFHPDQDRRLAWLLPEAADRADRLDLLEEHVAKSLRRADQLFVAMDRPASPPPGTELILAVADAVDTPERIAVELETGAFHVASHAPGDGTVLRSSALMDERLATGWTPRLESPIDWTDVTFFFEDHLGLTKDEAFTDNLLYLLLEAPR